MTPRAVRVHLNHFNGIIITGLSNIILKGLVRGESDFISFCLTMANWVSEWRRKYLKGGKKQQSGHCHQPFYCPTHTSSSCDQCIVKKIICPKNEEEKTERALSDFLLLPSHRMTPSSSHSHLSSHAYTCTLFPSSSRTVTMKHR